VVGLGLQQLHLHEELLVIHLLEFPQEFGAKRQRRLAQSTEI
jgi:hypothetical protein